MISHLNHKLNRTFYTDLLNKVSALQEKALTIMMLPTDLQLFWKAQNTI